MAVPHILFNPFTTYKKTKYRDSIDFDAEMGKGLLIHMYDYITDPQEGNFEYVNFIVYGKIIRKSKMGLSDGVDFEVLYSNSPHWRRKIVFLQYLSIIDDGNEFVKFFTNKYYSTCQDSSKDSDIEF